MIMSTFISAMLEYYHTAQWIQSLLFFDSLYILYVGTVIISSCVQCIQFGTDQLQLQGAPSDHLSAFVFWYLTIKLLLAALIQWIFYLLSLSKNKNITGRISLALSLLSALLISIALSIRSCFMSEWFSKFNESTISKNSNPYRLIYRALKFAKEHKYLVQRSAFTYWENEIPSRIDLGKRKYGGPFTTEEVENVRILNFLRLFKLLLSFTGLMHMVSSYFIQSGSTTLLIITPKSNFLISTLCHTATVGFLILARVLFSNFFKYYLSMLKQIRVGSVLTFTCALYILLTNCLEYTTRIGECYINIIAYLNLVIPIALFDISYTVLTVSLLEFIIA